MLILVTGANGFIGTRLVTALRAAGHEVIGVVRHARVAAMPGYREIGVDFARPQTEAEWVGRLAGVELVVNAVGIIRERGGANFAAVHFEGPRALFRACVTARVRRVIQISALGADEQAVSTFHGSKRDADEMLLGLPIDAVVVQPSLVFGPDSSSTRLFARLAALPLTPLPGAGEQRIQPIHVDDLVAAVVALTQPGLMTGSRIALVGPAPLSLRDYLGKLRQALGLGKARFAGVPLPLMRLAARGGDMLRFGLLNTPVLGMLMRGNTAAAGATTALLGRAPRGVDQFLRRDEAQRLLLELRLGWTLHLLRLAIALVWLGSGLVSLGVYPVASSYALLERSGVPLPWTPAFLYAAAALDLVLGVATLVLSRRRLLWLAQIGVILFYTAIITFRLPEFWLHPYGPVLKNLPMLAALILLYVLERRR